ncbi:MAG: hypothetical protein ABUL50_11570 [Rhizobacter sp.]
MTEFLRTGLIAVGLALVSSLAGAQTMYRCGNVYSQTPCASDAAPVKARGTAVADTPSGPQGADLCTATAVRELALDDGAPVQIGSITKAPAEVIQYADQPTATRKYLVNLKVKGAAVVYDGPRTYACHLSEDERRVLRFGVRRP